MAGHTVRHFSFHWFLTPLTDQKKAAPEGTAMPGTGEPDGRNLVDRPMSGQYAFRRQPVDFGGVHAQEP